jgi:predicted nuclease with TOPRIM domain
MDFGIIAAWVGIGITILGGVYKFGQVRQEMISVKEDLAEEKAYNTEQHRELFDSRNNMSDVLSRLTALFESMDKRQDQMDKKLDILIERRSVER